MCSKKNEILYQLDEMSEKNIGGVEIQILCRVSSVCTNGTPTRVCRRRTAGDFLERLSEKKLFWQRIYSQGGNAEKQ